MMADSVATSATSVSPASRPRRSHHALTKLRAHGPAAAVGLALGLLALGPGLARGFLLSYDMVFVPAPPFSSALLGGSGGPARAVPSDAAMTLAARVVPADIVQKVVLLLIFVLACSGVAALLADGWSGVTGRRAPTLACLVSGVFYTWNPFVAERLLIGQWALLLGFAGLPWVLREASTGPVRIKAWRLMLVMLPAAVGGFAALTLTALAAAPAALARGTGRERAGRLAVVLGALLVLSLPWLIPSLVVPVHTDPRGVDLFGARADTPFGRLGSLILLSGIWNAQTVPRGYGGAASAFWLIVVGCALAGYVLQARARRMTAGLGLAGLIGLAVAAIGISSPARALLREAVAAWPGFAVLRDGQQFVATLGLMEAIGLGAAVAWLLTRTVGSRATSTQASGRPEPAAVAVAVLALLASVVLLPGMAWGIAGRLRPAEYPADWLTARSLLDASKQPGSVLLLPWGAYRRYPWNHGEAVYDPWNKLLSRRVISNDGLQAGSQTLTQESAAAIQMNRIVTARGSLTAQLRAVGVRFVIIDAGPLLAEQASGLAAAARLPGAQVVMASRDLVVCLIPTSAAD
jgi:hypothetical protein